MRKSRYSEEQIAAALRQAEAGTPVAEITRKLDISEATVVGPGSGARYGCGASTKSSRRFANTMSMANGFNRLPAKQTA